MYIENEKKLKNNEIIQVITESLQVSGYEFAIYQPNDVLVYQTETDSKRYPPKNDPWGVPGTRQLLKFTLNESDSSYTITDYAGILKTDSSQAEFIETLKDSKRALRILFIDRTGINSTFNGQQLIAHLKQNAKANYLRQYAMANSLAGQWSVFGLHYTVHCSQKNPQDFAAFQQNAYISSKTMLTYPTVDIQLHPDIDYINQMNADNLHRPLNH